MNKVLINGRFLGKKVTGVQRFGREVLRVLDQRVLQDDLPDTLKGVNFEVVVPSGEASKLDYSALSVKELPWGSGHFWEQGALAWYDGGAALVSLCNAGPLFRKRHLAVVHDAAVFRMPGSYGWKYRSFHKLIGHALSRTAKLATVSEFSRRELSHFLNVRADHISVLGNSADHFREMQPSFDAIDRMSLGDKRFFLIIGSENKSKNISLVREAVALRPDDDWLVVVVGGKDNAVFRSDARIASDRFVYPGRLADEEIAGLAQRALALIFPSLYEGFGIPPLEAMTLGCPVAVSDIAPCREVCGEAALYFDPHDPASLAKIMTEIADGAYDRQSMIQAGLQQSLKFTWSGVVDGLLNILSREIEGAAAIASSEHPKPHSGSKG